MYGNGKKGTHLNTKGVKILVDQFLADIFSKEVSGQCHWKYITATVVIWRDSSLKERKGWMTEEVFILLFSAN